MEFGATLWTKQFLQRRDILAHRNRSAQLHVVTLIFGCRNSIYRKQLVVLAGTLTVANGDTQAIVRRPVFALTEGMRTRDQLLDQIVRHRLSGTERRRASSFQQFEGFG